MFKILCLIVLFIAPTIAEEYDKQCKCPENEEPGQKSCNGCEPTCDKPKPEVCTERFCKCSCDCVKGLLRNSQTKKCVPKNKCPLKCPQGEQPGSKRCNNCEPTCDKPNARPCTKIGCTSCDCIQGIVLTLRNTKTNKCVAQQQCPKY